MCLGCTSFVAVCVLHGHGCSALVGQSPITPGGRQDGVPPHSVALGRLVRVMDAGASSQEVELLAARLPPGRSW
jgi:hypothetical protein